MHVKLSPIFAYVLVVCLLSASLLVTGNWEVPIVDSSFWNTFVALLILAVFAELFSTRLSVSTATTSVSFVPYIASIVLLGPPWAMAIAGLTELVAETAIRRKELIKVLHNTSKEIVAVGVAGSIFVALGGIPSIDVFDRHFLAFAAAGGAYFIITNGATATAIGLSSATSLKETWGRVVGKTILFDLFASSLALLLAFLYVELELLGLLLVIIPLFFVRHTNQINLQLEQANRDLLELMVKNIEARDPYTSGHSQRVAAIAGELAREIGVGFREIEGITTAALLHDVGKIYEEFAPLLRKEGKLNEHERFVMESHPARSSELVSTISNLRGYVERCVRHHHENYDGSGYPLGLAGEDIPLGARIIMIADTTDAMTTDRPYRSALSYEKVVAELERYAGIQFDPELVEAFKRSVTVRGLVADRGRPKAPIMRPKPSKWRLRAAR
jgi:putative nucleotidyltransferase with HDIG domain